ncbi:MAG: excinuclease ABC subunit UvrA [Bacteroidaceae bacterium]|nr:excinuclease ABC subunit UvrA [Bacteroidaceae bacterium]
MRKNAEQVNNETIQIKGARVNNLKNIDLELPRDQFIVVTGLSGSGKSSLAFDTLYAEGQRRYVESLSAYARQFLGRMHKPECDYIKGLPPAIAIEQKVSSRNPRSTVGTSTEIYDYLRLLFARAGHTYSPVSGQEVRRNTPEDVVNCVLNYSPGTRFTVLAPVIIGEGRDLAGQLEMYMKAGLSRVDMGGEIVHIQDVSHDTADTLYLLIDRMSVDSSRDAISRLTDSVETAFFEGGGECLIRIYPSNVLHRFSVRFEADGITFSPPDDNMFSFNSPIGACPKCEGFGRVMGIDEQLVIPNSALSVYEGAVACWRGEKMGEWREEFCRRAQRNGFPIFEPYYNLTRAQKDILWHGDQFEKTLPKEEQVHIDAFFRMLEGNLYKIQYRVMLARYRGKTICPECRGGRLKKEAEYVKVGGKSITDLVRMPVSELQTFFATLSLSEHDAQVAERLLQEIRSRLDFLVNVGLGYLTLDRLSNSLSGGESQRINLATSLGSSLVGSLYILDEPSIGLHSRDTDRLIRVLHQLRDLGNTVIVVEHDEDIMRAADYLVDIGPEAGAHGGEVVWQGASESIPQAVEAGAHTHSHTLAYLAGTDQIPVPTMRRAWNNYIRVRGARANNLKGVDVDFPLNVFSVVTGVSGSGKSTLVRDILYLALKRHFDEVADRPGEHIALEGDLSQISGVEFVDQNPIGRSSRSNPATYIKAYDEIRKLMADQPLSKQMGYTPAYFSFNAPGGRCEECKGEGTVKVEMQFMADLVLECEACGGKRFKSDVLEVKFQGKNIYDILDMTVDESIEFFTNHGQEKIAKRLRPLQDVGLGYIKLGQSSSTLSGGENQRVKLAYYLSRESADPLLFIFDEPTTGLHFHDIRRLMQSFNALVERGHTVLVIEHNLDVVKCADHVIDLGPEGGREGGHLVIAGTPEEVVKAGRGYTARYLKEKLQ